MDFKLTLNLTLVSHIFIVQISRAWSRGFLHVQEGGYTSLQYKPHQSQIPQIPNQRPFNIWQMNDKSKN